MNGCISLSLSVSLSVRPTYATDVRLQARDTDEPQHKPNLERTKAAAQRQLPVPVICHVTYIPPYMRGEA
jgi:hypothetical protein